MKTSELSRSARYTFLALDARFTHSNPAIRSILTWVKDYLPAEDRGNISFLEHNINQALDLILEKIMRTNAQAVFFSCYIWNINLLKHIIADLRLLRPDLLIAVGGPEVEFSPSLSFEDLPQIDLVLQGEGELIFSTLLPYLKNFAREENFREAVLSDIRSLSEASSLLCGLAYLDKDNTLRTTKAAGTIDLNKLNFIYPDLSLMEHRHLYYESSRACPFHCTYCLSSRDDRLRFKDVDLVCQDLSRFIEAEVPLVKFIDRSFNAIPKRAREIWTFLIEKTRNKLAKSKNSFKTHQKKGRPSEMNIENFTRFHFEIEARLLKEEDFQLLATAPKGLFQFEIGIQSFDEQVLKNVRRSPDTQSIVAALTRLYEDGKIHCHADLLFGLPGQTLATIEKSFAQALACKADKIQLGFLKVLKGTPLYETAIERDFKWEKRAPYEILSTDLLRYSDLRLLKHLEAVFERFWDYALFPRSMAILQENTGSAFEFFSTAGQYFSLNGYLDRPLSQDEFFSRIYDYLLEEDSELSQKLRSSVKEDYLATPGALSSWETLRERYPRP